MFEEGIEFKSDDELRKPIAGTEKVQLRQRKDRETGDLLPLGDLNTGQTKKGVKWVQLGFEVVGGENDGEWASMMLFVRPDEKKFRKVFEVITGEDVSSGGKVGWEEFVNRLKTGVFEAELTPDVRDGEETGYTAVQRLNTRVGERDDAAGGSAESSGSSDADAPGGEEDIPF